MITQTNSFDFNADDLNMWGSGNALGGTWTLQIGDSTSSSGRIDTLGFTADYALSASANIGATFTATSGSVDVGCNLVVNASMPDVVHSGEHFVIDTSSWSASSLLTSTGPSFSFDLFTTFGVNASLTNIQFDAPGIDPITFADYSYSLPTSQHTLFHIDQTAANTSLTIGAGTLSASLPAINTSGQGGISVTAQGKSTTPFLGGAIDLDQLAAFLATGASADLLEGTWGDKNGPHVDYTLFDADLAAGLYATQRFQFDVTSIGVTMVSSYNGETRTGELGDAFIFSTPSTGDGTVTVNTTYTLNGTLTNSSGVVGNCTLNVTALNFDLLWPDLIDVTIPGVDKSFGENSFTDPFYIYENTQSLSALDTVNAVYTVDYSESEATGGSGTLSNVPSQSKINFYGTSGDDYLYANNLDNSIYGYAGNDVIFGYAGNDVVYAGDGSDTVNAGSGNDTVDAGGDNDTVSTGAGDDTIKLSASSGWDYVDGGAGSDLLSADFSGAGNYLYWYSPSYSASAGSSIGQIQAMLANAANTATLSLYAHGTGGELHNIERYDITATAYGDLLIYLPGGRRYLGGSGTDTFYADWSTSTAAIVWQNTPTQTQTVNGVTVSGLERLLIATGAGDDTISNTAVDTGDYISAGAGNDIINGGNGSDTIDGGAGNDIINGGNGNDTVDGGAGNDRITLSGNGATVQGGAGDDVIRITNNDTGYGSYKIDGGTGNDTLSVTTIQSLFMSEWRVTSTSGQTISLVTFPYLPDVFSQWMQIRQAITEGIEYALYGADGGGPSLSYSNIETVNLSFVGTESELLLYRNGTLYRGGGGTDTFYADWSGATDNITWKNDPSQTQTVHGVTVSGLERLLIATGAGDDTISNTAVDTAVDTGDYISAGAGNDTINSGKGSDTIDGGDGNDIINGGNGSDTIDGGDGNDQITLGTGAGDDTVQGGAGDDVIRITDDNIYHDIYKIDGGTGDDVIWIADNTTDYFYYSDYYEIDGGAGNDTLNVTITQASGDVHWNVESASGQSLEFFAALLSGGWTWTDAQQFLAEGVQYELMWYGSGEHWQFSNIETVNLSFGDSSTGSELLLYRNGTLYRGGGGTDTFYADWSASTAAVVWQNTPTQTQTVNGVTVSGLERLLIATGSGNDTIGNTAVDTNDYISTGAGNDTINGGQGADQMIGGNGNDTYTVDNTSDVVKETNADAAQIDTVQSTLANYILPANVENLRLLGTGSLNGAGNGLNNTLYANRSNNVLDGGAGSDTVSYQYGATSGVKVSLAITTAQATGGSGSDTLLNIENLTGSGYADTLTGNGGNNVLNGLAGADTLAGGNGNDTYVVDNTGDAVKETNASTTQIDTVQSSLTAYTLGAHVENLQLLGTAAINGTGNNLDNTLYANSGNNTLDGGAGIDTVSYFYGATSGVTASLAIATAQATGGSGSDTLLNLENLTGSGYADILTGNWKNNVLKGLAGADILAGANGNDTYVIENMGDTVKETNASLTQIDTVQTWVSHTLGANVENLQLLGAGNLSGIGNGLANVLYANSGNNVLNGGAGIDTVSYQYGATKSVAVNLAVTTAQATGGSGSDSLAGFENLVGSAYADTLAGNGAANRLIGGAGADILKGWNGDDTYIVDHISDSVTESIGAGIDAVQSSVTYTLPVNVENLALTGTSAIDGMGNGLANTLTGNGAANRLNGGAGADTLKGWNGNDTYVVDNTGDSVTESSGAGIDTVQSAVPYTLGANVENLTLTGTAALNGTGNALANMLQGNDVNNALNGGFGTDILKGWAGNDTLNGGADADTLYGGAGNDIFVFNGKTGADVVTDFMSGTDKLKFSQAALPVGDGDTVLEGAVALAGPGGFLKTAELVIATQNIAGGIAPSSAAAAIGSATAAYAAGAHALFAVDNGSQSAVYYFTAANANAIVEANELVLLATLSATASTVLADYGLAA
jgi:Ca2+-binding RTX toxin-like protein